jgi:23S rRNA pseudouridine2605 synthase
MGGDSREGGGEPFARRYGESRSGGGESRDREGSRYGQPREGGFSQPREGSFGKPREGGFGGAKPRGRFGQSRDGGSRPAFGQRSEGGFGGKPSRPYSSERPAKFGGERTWSKPKRDKGWVGKPAFEGAGPDVGLGRAPVDRPWSKPKGPFNGGAPRSSFGSGGGGKKSFGAKSFGGGKPFGKKREGGFDKPRWNKDKA